jgi:PAS domain S-box-containing protein
MSIRSIMGEFSAFLIHGSIIKFHVLSRISILAAPLFAVVANARQERNTAKVLIRRYALGKRIVKFWEDLVTRPPESMDEGIRRGLKSILQVAVADRISWCEIDEGGGELLRLFAVDRNANAPALPAVVPLTQIPFISQALLRTERVILRELEDLPVAGETDRQLLEQLGVRSVVIVPSNYQGTKRKGALALTSYTEKGTWTEEFIEQLACLANIIGAVLERQITLEASQKSDARFQLLFEQASIGIVIETAEGQMLHVNPAFCGMIGYTEQELLNSTCERISHPDDEELERPLFEELRQGIRSSYVIEKRFYRKDGSILWGQVSVFLLKQNQGLNPIIIAIVSDVTAQKAVEDSLRRRDQELQHLAGQLITAQESERGRISRELHDDIGNRMAMVACEMEVLQRSLSARSLKNGRNRLQELKKVVDQLATDIHNLSHELHSSSLQHCGLGVALKALCNNYAEKHAVKIDLAVRGLDPKLAEDASLCLFRVAQEALANALKHSLSKRILVEASQDSGKVRLCVKDFGIGFNPAAATNGIGLTSMRERLRICGGVLRVSSTPNLGAEIVAELPVPAKTQAAMAGCASRPN